MWLKLLQVIGLKLLGLEHKQGLLLPLLGKAGLKKITRKSCHHYQWIEESQKVIVLNCFPIGAGQTRTYLNINALLLVPGKSKYK